MSSMPSKEENELLQTMQFDAEWYRQEYADVALLGLTSADHYLRYGRALGRMPNGSHLTLPSLPKSMLDSVNFENPSTAADLICSSLSVYKSRMPQLEIVPSKQPLVSVIMTAHNSEQTIVRSVESILFQTWSNLEVIVVDDASSDGTWSLLSAMAMRFKGSLRIFRLQSNVGTYVAKNIGIVQAKGEIIFFQDSDDYSHPERVALQAAHLASNPSAQANRTKYCRFNPGTGLVIPISGHPSKLGLITLAVRRTLFERVGFFDPVRKAGDDEWFERARTIIGREHFVNLDVALYAAELRQNSLAQDLFVTNFDGGLVQRVAGDRAEYGKLYTARHASFKKDERGFREQSPPVPMLAPTWVPDALATVPKKRLPVYAAMCSIPAREKVMRSAVGSVINQIDHLFLYLDKYESVPDFLTKDPRITVIRSQDVSRDLRDNAKFLPYNKLKQENPEFLFLTFDDDIIYPHDYVIHHMRTSESFSWKCVTGVHGVVYDDFPERYFDRRIVYHYRKDALKLPILVNGLGTGTVMFHSSVFDSIDPFAWGRGGMVDIYFSIHALLNKVPMLVLSRTAEWMTDVNITDNGPTLYDEFKSKDKLIVDALVKYQPWGYRAISELIESLDLTMRQELYDAMPAFAAHAPVKVALQRYRG